MKDKIRLCIPGTWIDQSHFIETVRKGSGGRLVDAGSRILDRETGQSAEYGFFRAAEGMEAEFRLGSSAAPFDEALLKAIGRHESYVCLYSDKGGTAEALSVSESALTLLDNGGIAVRVEGSKRASSPEQWRRGVEDARRLGAGLLYRLFVWVFVSDGQKFDSIGMPFLGHPDVSVETDDIELAVSVFNEFARYLLHEGPNILNGQTIGFEDSDGVWRMTKTEHIYADDPDIDFSLGMWRLQRL